MERHRQEMLFESQTGGYAGDVAHAKAQGATLITFKDWLKANRRDSVDDYDMGSDAAAS